ncbi:hypothetical protein [Agathobaculum sp. Marseille-P7918]|uniref:hypothetical protein n=1 Tax=Agathobaculum sp. Marseille-P7918 TaxID=2479843 RepID=UPI000F62CE5B|nr:hypothetical protein [Agathobaculum sp. Marseille-P7918]
MTSRNFSSKGLLGDSLRRNLWGFVLGGVGFFLSLPLPLLMTMQKALENRARYTKDLPDLVDIDWKNALNQVASLLDGGNYFVKTMLIIMAIVCGVAMFAYLHSRQKVDFYHSLPILRTRLFANNFLTGIILSLSTYLVMLVLSVACVYGMGFGAAVDWGAIGSALVSQLILFLTIYALTVLTTIVCGNTVITLLLLAWVHLSPMLARFLFVGLCEKFYQTYAMESEHVQQAFYLSPLIEMFEINGFTRGGKGVSSLLATQTPVSAVGLLIAYLIVAVAATALALFLFRIRRSERAGVALAFPRAKLPIKVYMCLFMGVAFGMVFSMIAGNFWFWIGLVIGTVLFHWIVEIIYAFDFRAILGKPLHLIVILVVLFAGILCMKFDVTGYDSWLPDRDDIQAVSVGGDASELLYEAANIDAAYRLGEIGTQINRDALYGQGNFSSITLRFQLSGRSAARTFLLPDEDAEVQTLLHQIYASEEYKRAAWPLFQLDLEDEQSTLVMDIYSDASDYNVVSAVKNEQDIRQIVTTLREESLTRQKNSLPVLRLQFMREGEDYTQYEADVYVTAEDEKTLALIKQLTGVSPVPLTTDNVDMIDLQFSYSVGNGEYRVESVQVTDKSDIAALLKNAANRDTMGFGSIRNAAKQGIWIDPRTDSMEIVARIKQNGEENWYQLAYADGDWPEAIVEKYRPDEANLDNNAVADVPATEAAA